MASDPKIVFDNFSDPGGPGTLGGGGSILDSVKMINTGLTPEQEMAKNVQSRKGIQTSPDGELQCSNALLYYYTILLYSEV